MHVAVVAHPPVFGAKVKSFDDKAARASKACERSSRFQWHVAGRGHRRRRHVLARKQGARPTADQWDFSGVERADSAQLWTKYKALARTTGNVAVARGDARAIERIAAASRIVAEYEFPYLAHTPMEPLNTTVRVDGDRAEYGPVRSFRP
jgi:isoquinoline 1-oxidoreductase beta subunit